MTFSRADSRDRLRKKYRSRVKAGLRIDMLCNSVQLRLVQMEVLGRDAGFERSNLPLLDEDLVRHSCATIRAVLQHHCLFQRIGGSSDWRSEEKMCTENN